MTALGSRNGLQYRIGTADENVLHEVFDQRAYALDGIPVKPAPDRPLIIDAGAHIGAASVWLLREWPGATIIGVEPDRENRDLMLQNTIGMPIYTLRSAVMSQGVGYKLDDPGLGTWGYRTSPAPSEPTRSRTVPALFDVLPYHQPWLMKIDIEGGEAELFSANTEWIDRVPVIMIELHDWLIPGSGDTWRASMAGRSRREFGKPSSIVVSVREDWLA